MPGSGTFSRIRLTQSLLTASWTWLRLKAWSLLGARSEWNTFRPFLRIGAALSDAHFFFSRIGLKGDYNYPSHGFCR